jgi:H/ACA ribonucleoprotein complex non-core subunit NAF1
MRDDELMDADNNILFSGDAYAERGPYDIDYTSLPGPSSSSSSHRAAVPYDDPYADDVGVVEREGGFGLEARAVRGRERAHHAHGRGRGRGGHGHGRARGGGGRGREREREGRRRGGHQPPPSTPPVGMAQQNSQATGYFGLQQQQQQQQQSEYSPFYPEQHPLSLPFPPYATYPMQQPASPMTPFGVQPHINPRFASAFGLASPSPTPPSSSSLAQQEYLGGNHIMYSHAASSQAASSDWADSDGWSVPMQKSGSREEAGS